MKASDLVRKLEAMIEMFGDLEVVSEEENIGKHYPVTRLTLSNVQDVEPPYKYKLVFKIHI